MGIWGIVMAEQECPLEVFVERTKSMASNERLAFWDLGDQVIWRTVEVDEKGQFVQYVDDGYWVLKSDATPYIAIRADDIVASHGIGIGAGRVKWP
jgi:hypothetical protein